ncbi:MAG: hypothetical protein K2R93_14915 [Gemmatimonadaceae bacterium]|nr:hypothetical protein [Gemmatimonadaceae bacterium]
MRGLVLVRPFFALFARPSIAFAAWVVVMALAVASLHLGDVGFALAFSGHPGAVFEDGVLARVAHQLVLHGSALVSLSIGMMSMLAAAEVDLSPRLALTPRFRESMRSGMLLLMAIMPLVGWAWAHTWAPVSSLWLALAWTPFWFAISSWGRLLSRAPRFVEASPVVLLIMLMMVPRWYVRVVDVVGWPGAVLSVGLAIVGVVSSWSPRVREITRLRSQRAFDVFAFLASWRVGAEERAVDAPVTRPASTMQWLSYLNAERMDSWRTFLWRVLGLGVILGAFVFVGHASPGLLGASVPPMLATGRPLLYPLGRRDRARIQYLVQLQDLWLYAIAALLGAALASLVPTAWIPSDFAMGARAVPIVVQLGAAVALWPVPQWKSLSAPIHSGDVAAPARNSQRMLLHLAMGMLVYLLGVEGLSRLVWRESAGEVSAALGALAAVGAVAQLVWFLFLHWHFRRADLAPSEG